MKRLFLFALISFATSALADWTETVDCTIERGSVDELTVVSSKSSAQLQMSGPHNGETGQAVISNSLIPSYSVTYSMISSGRTDEASLVTKFGDQILALSSVDTQQSKFITNKFLTTNGDYQVTITCSSRVNN